MIRIWRRIAAMLGINPQPVYAWPGMDVALPDHRQLHMVGSIHMGTRDMTPLPAPLLSLLRRATALIVEADITASTPLLTPIAIDTPLSERLSHEHYRILTRLCQEYRLDEKILAPLAAWHIAMILQLRQAEQMGLHIDYGIDYQLIQAAKDLGKPVIELEGHDKQMELLLQMPDQGNALLQDTLSHWHTNARLLQTMMSWWINRGPTDAAKAFPPTLSGEIYQYLMTERNQRWKTRLEQLPPGDYLVAVGALHLYGEENLPSLLQQR